MESVGDAVVNVVREIVVESSADVSVDRLKLDENKWYAVHEADKIGASIVVRHADALEFQLPNSQKAILARIAEIDNARVSPLRLAGVITPFHGNAIADKMVKVTVVLD